MTNWIQKYQKGKVFLQPNSPKLPRGYATPESSELATSIGGEEYGVHAYLVPGMKYGWLVKDPIKEFLRTGEHLGGPFKTWQEADKWEREIRHPYVEKGQPIPSPIRTWGKGIGNTTPDAMTGAAKQHVSSVNELRQALKNKTNNIVQSSGSLYDFNNIGIDNGLYTPEQKKIKDWLVARQATGRFKDQLGGTHLPAQLMNLASVNDMNRFSFYQDLADKWIPGAKWDERSKWLATELEKSIHAGGEYTKDIHSLYVKDLGSNAKNSSVKVHENVHALNAIPQKIKIHEITNWTDGYLDDPNEIYSRLMEYRIRNNIDPNKIFTIEDIKKLKKKSGEKDKLIDRYPENELLRLFNEVADSGDKKNEVPMAQNGGLLSNDQIRTKYKEYRNSPEWYAKSSGRAEMTDSPIDMLLMGWAGGKGIEAGVSFVGSKVLPYLSKIYPKKFKVNPDAFYRMVGGKEGYMDLKTSGVIRPKPGGVHSQTGRTYYSIGEIIDKRNPLVTGGAKRGTYYRGPYMVEVSPGEKVPELVTRLNWNFGVTKLGNEIPISAPNVKIYKQDWLRKYKEVPKK